jgi:hypothetical protein
MAFLPMATIKCYVDDNDLYKGLTEQNSEPPGGLVTFMDISSLRDVIFV